MSAHSFLPNDSNFSDIECALKHQQRLYLPDEYVNIMQDCSNKKISLGTVTKMKDLEKRICNRKVENNNNNNNGLTESLTLLWPNGKPYRPKLNDLKSVLHLPITLRCTAILYQPECL
jgi:hypothetical protein